MTNQKAQRNKKGKNTLKNYDGPRCGRRIKTCTKSRGGCGYRYTKVDYKFWNCPNCGFDRHCPNPVSSIGDACRVHGRSGAVANAGVNSSTWKHGKYSKYVPANFLEFFEESLSDPELLNFAKHLAVLDARIKQLFSQMEEGDNSLRWEEAIASIAKIKSHAKSGDTKAMAQAMLEHETILKRGNQVWRTWDNMIKTMDAFGRANEREQKRLERLGMMMTRDEVYALFKWFVDLVKLHVTDKQALKAIHGELIKRNYHG